MKIDVIICAAGRGERAKLGRNKVLAPLHGAPVLYHTLEAFAGVGNVIVAASAEDMEETGAICAPFNAKVVEGGSTRTQSVCNALEYCEGDIVLIHDGARPYVSREVIDGCIECAKRNGSAICAVEVTDTIAVSADGRIESVPQRSSLCALQTPQGFITKDIKAAYKKAVESGESFTDDSSVYARFIGQPVLCKGATENIKLTYKKDFPEDMPLPAAARGQALGVGVDVHAFGKEQSYVTLCGVKVPCDTGLIAHSDGDVAVHAVMDALLSAAGLNDIGYYFPDTDPAYSGADSIKLLERAAELVRERGLKPVSLSVTVQAEKPRLSAYKAEMRANLARALNLDGNNVGVAAGTCEKLGFVGKKLGIAAYAAVLCEETENG
ncbi:MAG: 2-C-methyl-D-erythritol 4-phosphate cytidylyltransferase [Candidatus Coproplasma sp.]